jgi:hypothetical protein
LEIKNELRLDYNSPQHKYGKEYYDSNTPNPFIDSDGNFLDEPVALIRFRAVEIGTYKPPFEFEDVEYLKQSHPLSGSGFLGGIKVIPEFKLSSRIDIRRNTEIYIKNIDGTERLIARLIGFNRWEIY